MYLRYKKALTATLALLFLIMVSSSFAADEKVIAKIDNVGGNVTVIKASGEIKPLKAGDTLSEGDIINTGSDSNATIRFLSGETVTLGALANYKIGHGHLSGESYFQAIKSLRGNSPTLSTATSAGGSIGNPDAPTTPDAGGSPTN